MSSALYLEEQLGAQADGLPLCISYPIPGSQRGGGPIMEQRCPPHMYPDRVLKSLSLTHMFGLR